MSRTASPSEAWSPIAQGGVLDDAGDHGHRGAVGRTPAQVVLRGTSSAATSSSRSPTTPERIEENFALFDFELDDAAIERIAGLDRGEDGRTGPNPDTFDSA